MELVVGLVTFLAVHSTIADLSQPGICTFIVMIPKHRYAMDRTRTSWIHDTYFEPLRKEKCCDGYEAKHQDPLSCSPVCDPPCENSDCMGPNICVCHFGHVMINNSSSTCNEICDSCVNGACHGNDTECTCNIGYERDQNYSHICNPTCSNACVNATCVAPESCQCFIGYEKHSDKSLDHICIPKCTESCIYGTCTEPDICTCLDGYINDRDSSSICLPVCNRTCENGDCHAPDTCKCREGFEVDPDNPYRCVSSKNFCKWTLPNAVKYDRNSDCFELKDKLILSVSPQCRVLNLPESHAEMICSSPSKCSHKECILNFSCSKIPFNGLNEIQCKLEEYEQTRNSTSMNNIINTTVWSDVVFVINSNHTFSSIEIQENQTKEWTLHPLSRMPVCGKMQFSVEMSSCGSSLMGKESNHINSSLMFWINVFLICGFLLLLVTGIGGFLWARYRRLNDPLNYREDMIQGYYNNQCYNNGPGELVSDDDSDRESDAPL